MAKEETSSEPDDGAKSGNKKDMLIRAIELILADPTTIKKQTVSLLKKYRSRYKDDESDDDIRDMVAKKIIENYSYWAAFSGGATALAGVVPGLGTVIATFGGATADVAVCMKLQIEMVMALACVYDHNIEQEEERMMCFLIAGLGAIANAGKEGGKQIGTKAFVKMVQTYLAGASLVTVKEVFRQVGVTFTRKALEKSIPFGIGVVIGFSVNKVLTWYVGEKAHDYFKTN